MYKSLMFKSNPLTEELHQGDSKGIKTLQIKNYSFSKIDKTNVKKTIKNNFINNTFNVKKNRYLINNSTLSPKQTIKHSTIDKHKNLFLNPQDSFNFDKQTNNLNVQNHPNIRILNSRRRIFKNDDPKRIPSNDKPNINILKASQKHDITKQEIQEIIKSNRNIKSQMKQSRYEKINQSPQLNKMKQSFVDCSGLEKTGHNLQQKQKQKQKDNKLRTTLYQSINLDNIFEKIELKVKEPENQNKQENNFPSQNLKFLQKFQKQLKSAIPPKSKNPFDQFNLKFLINKKKTFKIQNQNQIKGSNMPYYQSLSSRGNRKQQTISQQKSVFQENDSTYEDNIANFSMGPHTQRSRMNKTAYRTIQSSQIKNNSRINESAFQQGRNSKSPIQLQNLKQSLKIQSLRQMFKHQQLKFV